MREICFDTETTGLYADNGDRIIEIGAVELVNHIPTGREYHVLINPERDVPIEAVKIHGIDNDVLKDKPVFKQIAQEWIDFVGEDSLLVAHNAEFDIKFINMELERCGLPKYDFDRVVDTLAIAKKQFPKLHNSLNDLCKRFGIDNSSRTLHGALIDSQLLAKVYLQLMGGNEPSINFISNQNEHMKSENEKYNKIKIIERHFEISEEEQNNHINFLQNDIKNSIWLSSEKTDYDK